MNAANPSDESKARFAELARKYEPKLPRKFAQMMPFKDWIRELRAKGASCDDIRTLLADVNVSVANDTVHRFCRDMIGAGSHQRRSKSDAPALRQAKKNAPQEQKPSVQSASLAVGLAEQRGQVLGPWTPRKRGPRIADSKNL